MILIFGSSGLLATSLYRYLIKRKLKVIRQSRSSNYEIKSNVNSLNKVRNILLKYKPKYVLNTIALANVDLCEKETEYAFYLNGLIPKYISHACLEMKIPFIHISTDHVYNTPGLNDEDNINIVNKYAESKYLGDINSLANQAIVLRTNFVGKSLSIDRVSFTDWIINNVINKDKINLFSDVFFSALHTKQLANIIVEILKKPKAGLYNVGASNSISKCDFGLRLLEHLNITNNNCNSAKLASLDLIAKRPKYMGLSVKRIENSYQIKMPSMDEVIKLCASDYKNDL